MTLYGVVCLLEFARDHWASDALKAKLQFVPNLTWQGWTIGALALLCMATLEGAYRAVRVRDNSIDSERQAVLAHTAVGADAERDGFIVLAGQLRHFLEGRRADYVAEFSPGRFPTPYEQVLDMQEIAMGETGKRARQKESKKSIHHASTLKIYGDQFALRVFSANRRLRELGINEATTGHLGEYPSTVADVEAIVSELKAASAALPSIPAPETTEERLWNLRYQAEAPELAMKILTGPRANSEPKPYLVIDYVSAWRGYVSDQDPDGEEYFEEEEFLKFTNASDEVIRRIQVEPFTIWGTEISTELVPTLIPHGEPAQKRLRGIEDQLKKANIGLRAFHKKPVGVSLIVTYYGQSDRQCVGRHALVYDKGNIRVEPLIDGGKVDWLDASAVVAAQEER